MQIFSVFGVSQHSGPHAPHPVPGWEVGMGRGVIVGSSSSNICYITNGNRVAGRTYNNINQYPVLPWVLEIGDGSR